MPDSVNGFLNTSPHFVLLSIFGSLFSLLCIRSSLYCSVLSLLLLSSFTIALVLGVLFAVFLNIRFLTFSLLIERNGTRCVLEFCSEIVNWDLNSLSKSKSFVIFSSSPVNVNSRLTLPFVFSLFISLGMLSIVLGF